MSLHIGKNAITFYTSHGLIITIHHFASSYDGMYIAQIV